MRRRLFVDIVTPFLVPPAAPAPYSGPGDVVSGAIGWWGLRGYSNAYSTGSNPAIDVVDAATGLITTTVNILANGNLDNATILALGYAVKVKKIYDQTGNNMHVTQATLANMPALTQNVIGTLPGMTFSGSQSLTSGAWTSTTNEPYVFSGVGERTGNTSNFADIIGSASTTDPQLGFSNSANNALLYNGIIVSFPGVNDNAFHAMQGLFNAAASSIYVDGSSSGAVNPSGGSLDIGQMVVIGSGDNFLTGIILEAGIWPSDISASFSAMNSNQHTYWGF